ncbi:MAG: ABC transporter permease subunit [Rhodobacter sp.]|jgi:spermidine/putrescine transport system permease protein|nr:ABC transporter permease subunit [Rhodobacter sp.]
MPRPPVTNLWQGILPAMVLMAGFFLLPILYTLGLSLTTEGQAGLTLVNYHRFWGEDTLTDALLRSLALALSVVVIATLFAWPLAWYLAFCVSERRRVLLLLILVAPFWTSFTIRAFSWQMVLADSGIAGTALRWVAGTDVSLGFLYSLPASVFGLGLFGIMLVTLMVYSSMVTIDRRLIEANAVLGGTGWTAFREVVLPLALPGWIIGVALTFIVAVGDYAVPTLLGGGLRPVLAQVMLSVLKGTYDLPMAATLASVLVMVILLCVAPLLLLVRGTRLQS